MIKKLEDYEVTIRYDTVYIYVRSKAEEMASLVSARHRNKKLKKTKNKNRLAQKKWSGQKSAKAVREEQVKLRGGQDL